VPGLPLAVAAGDLPASLAERVRVGLAAAALTLGGLS
jgi:hypothetical protein